MTFDAVCIHVVRIGWRVQDSRGIVNAARLQVGVCEVAARDEGVRVDRPEDPHTTCERLLEQGDRLTKMARRLVGARKVVAGGECVGVVGPQDAHTVSEHALVQRDRLTKAPRRLVAAREGIAGGECEGVVVSQNAHMVASTPSNRVVASPRRPAAR